MKTTLLVLLTFHFFFLSAQETKNQPKGFGIQFALIPKGSFYIGSPVSEVGRFESEGLQKRIEFKEDFWMGKYEITQKQYYYATGNNPSFFSNCDTCPVEQVSFEDAIAFVELLNQQNDGFFYSLPSEAEWEYAARAGTTTPFHFGNTLGSHQANFNGGFPYGLNYGGPNLEKTVPVGNYDPNAWGLYDMHGNVNEWTLDVHSSDLKNTPTDGSPNTTIGNLSRRIVRGGDWSDIARVLRSADRSYAESTVKYKTLGIRVVARLKTNATFNNRHIGSFSENGFASFYILKEGKKKYGIIDRASKVIVPEIYEKAEEDKGVFWILTPKAAGIIDFTGKIIIPPTTFWNIITAIPGVYVAWNKPANKMDFISDYAIFDVEGKAILPRGAYSNMDVLPDGTLRVDYKGITYIIAEKGIIVSPKDAKPEKTENSKFENEEVNKWTAYINQNPEDPDGYLQRGIAYYNIQNFALALADLSKSIKINPEYMTGHASYWRAEIYFKQGKFELSLSDINQNIKLETTNSRALPDLMAFRARIYCKLGLKVAAAEDEKKAIELGGEIINPCK